MKEVAHQLNANKEGGDTQWDLIEGRIRCMEHAIHLGACHFIRTVSPTSARVLAKKIKKAICNGDLGNDGTLADLGDDNDNDNDNNNNNDADDDDDAASEAGALTVDDTIGKSLALVKSGVLVEKLELYAVVLHKSVLSNAVFADVLDIYSYSNIGNNRYKFYSNIYG
jgi:hypothetical protein